MSLLKLTPLIHTPYVLALIHTPLVLAPIHTSNPHYICISSNSDSLGLIHTPFVLDLIPTLFVLALKFTLRLS